MSLFVSALALGAKLIFGFPQEERIFFAAQEGDVVELGKEIDAGFSIDHVFGKGITLLFVAAAKGKTDAVEYLLSKGASVDLTQENPTPLFAAAEGGHEEALKMLIQQGGDKEFRWERGATPLLIAVEHGHYEAARILLEMGANVHAELMQAGIAYSFLHLAMTAKRDDILTLGIQYGAEVNTAKKDATTPLYFAASFGVKNETARILIEHGGDVNVRGDQNGFTPLLIAIQQKHFEVAKYLIEKGADINLATTTCGSGPLLVAVQHGCVEMVQPLIDKGANINAQNARLSTPIVVAIDAGHLHAANILIQNGADLTLPKLSPPLYYAVLRGNVEGTHLLVESGADINIKGDKVGFTPLMIALQEKHFDLALYLLDKGADVNMACTADGHGPLHLAALRGHTQVIQLLIDKGAKVNAANHAKITPLCMAAERGHLEIAKILLQNDADLTIPKKQAVPLFLASENGYPEMIKLLLKNGASVHECLTDNGWTALHVAARKNRVGCAKVLLEAGANVNASVAGLPTPLMSAATAGSAEMVNFLISLETTQNVKILTGQTAAELARVTGEEAIAKKLENWAPGAPSCDHRFCNPCSPLPESLWKPDNNTTECKKCAKTFNVFTRKHHCRSCGEIFCDDCTPNKWVYLPLPHIGKPKGSLLHNQPERVCGGCLECLQEKEPEIRKWTSG